MAFAGDGRYRPIMYLLRERKEIQVRRREEARLQTCAHLWSALRSLCPGLEVFVFGSLIRPGAFHEKSDVDVAVTTLPEGISLYSLIGLLEERLLRPVDALLLSETRLREKILARAERWIA